MGKHAGNRPITEPNNLAELLDNPKVNHVRIRHTIQEPPMEPLGVVTEGNGVPVVRAPRRKGVSGVVDQPVGKHQPNGREASRLEKAFLIHRIVRPIVFLLLCLVAGTAWTGLMVSAWDIVSDIWWCWVFVLGCALGVVLFSYDLYVAIRYRSFKQAQWKGMA